MLLDYMLAFSVLNASLSSLVNLYEEKYRLEDKRKAFNATPVTLNLPSKRRETYDFIIVGGGTSGCIVSRRLADANFSVLVLEQGGNPPPLETIPYLSPALRFEPAIHVLYGSTRQKNSGLNNGGTIRSSGGKMMGGSSSHNEAQYERGSPFDFDLWAEDVGDKSWRYENVLPYFLKSENYMGRFPNPENHHTGGLLGVVPGNVSFRHDLWFSAGRELNYSVSDSNGPQKVGFSPAEYNRNRGRRVSAYSGFVRPVEHDRPNLTIRRYSVVSEIVFEDKKAYAVKYEHHGIPSIAFCSKEIILSAGAYLSPIILIKSGIGPRDQLQAAKKDPVSILPVGKNLQDHVVVPLPPIIVKDRSVIIRAKNNISFDDIDEYLDEGKGPITWDGMHEAFIASNRASIREKNAHWPDLQLYFKSPVQPDSLTCHVNLNRPYSRGRIYYNSTAQTLQESLIPIIDYNFFSDDTDMNVVLEGIELCHKLVETKTFKEIGAYFSPTPHPNCVFHHPLGFRKYYRCYIKQVADTNNHVVGTCKMGKPNDPQTVVDSKLKVLGVTGLRVIDASIMPFEVNANIAAAVMMVAEKGAADIIKDWS